MYGQDIGIICRQWKAIALWILGYPDQALSMNPVTVEMARASNHVSTLAYVLYFTAKIFQFIREGKIVRELSEECQVLSASHDNHFFQAAGSVLHGWALVDDGKMAAGKALLHQNINAYQATGAELVVPYWLTLLAEAYAKEGLIDDGLAAVDQALHIAEKGGEHMWDAEIYRIRGELLLLKSEDSSEAEQCFEKALDIARRQEAKSWELRAATSLSRLWRRQNRKAEAGELLAGIYGWFTEGFTTYDLVEARALLDELSPEIRS